MSRIKLGKNARQEIVDTIKRCRTSTEIAAEAKRLADHYGVHPDRIYKLTADVRPRRKTRSDKGKRVADFNHDSLKVVGGWMLEYNTSAVDAVRMAEQRGLSLPVGDATINRYFRQEGLDKRSRLNETRPHRRFEASAPGEFFQFDISGLKERYLDPATRRLIYVSPLEVSKNHANSRADRVRVWRFVILDDFSRRCFVRYVGVDKPNSSHVVDFLLQAYAELGVPKILYTDNDKIIKFGRNAKTTELLNKLLLDQGGYENRFHEPGNSQATGKVERLHKTIEVCEKVIGIFIAERKAITLEDLNTKFAPGVEQKLNNRIHGTTGQAPMVRWESAFSVIRRLDYTTLRSAFMADEFDVKLRGDLTFRLKGQSFQLPTSDLYPFANWINQKLRVVFPDDLDFYTVIGIDGNEYDIAKTDASADVAGEYKSTRQTNAQTRRKELKAAAKEYSKRQHDTNEQAPIIYFDESPDAVAASAVETNVSRFPKPETEISVVDVAAAAPGRPLPAHDPAINFWEAVDRFQSRFASRSDAKQFMDSLFSSRDETCWLLSSEVENAIAARQSTGADANNVRLLKAV